MAAEGGSSSAGELSSPPKSPSPVEDLIVVNQTLSFGNLSYPNLTNAVAAASATNGSSATSGGGKPKDEVAEKPPRKRRARTVTADGKDDEPSKPTKAPRKTRAPRKPKAEAEAPKPASVTVQPAAPATTVTAAGSATATSTPIVPPSMNSRPSSRQQKITDLVNPDPPKYQGNFTSSTNPVPTYQNGNSSETQRQQTFKSEPSTNSSIYTNQTYSPGSGQRYDPIRSSTMDNPRPYPSSTTPMQTSPTKAPYRASASPSISSLIDPPVTVSNPTFSYTPPAKPSPIISDAIPTAASSKSPNLMSTKPSSQQTSPNTSTAPNSATAPTQLDVADAMDVDVPAQEASRKTSVSGTNPPSKAASPKPTKKEKDKVGTTPPLPPLPGSSAIASTLFGPGSTTSETVTGPTIILHIPLSGETNKYINFARLAEEKYSFSALHPRLAAQRERLARVAAAGAALENAQKGSGDEMSLDLLSDGEPELSNAEMGDAGADSGKEGSKPGDAEGKKPRKKRRMKEDMYDQEDPFVDDSEMAWEEQAAASKDGFFVYSGPLIPEGETARVERADGTIIKPPSGRGRGRGRGGGPGSRGGTTRTRGGGAAGGGEGSAANSKGGGPGSRGGKPRAKRGEKKAEREAAAAAAATAAGDSAASVSNTTPARPATKTEPAQASPLGQTVQVQLPMASSSSAALHNAPEAPAVTA